MILLIGLCLVASGSLYAQAPLTAQQLAQRVDKYYNNLRSLRTEFTESFHGMGIDRQESGSLVLRKPGKMHWTYTKPPGKIFLLDAKYAWFYTSGDAQVMRVPAAQLDDLRSPLRFLLGHTQLQKEFDGLTLATTAEGFELSGVPKGMQDRVANITLGVTADGVIHSMKITETDDAETTFTFKNSQPNAPVPDTDFIFPVPPGIPVVDGLPPV
jgi:outer membrane lipoprotein carrier protein